MRFRRSALTSSGDLTLAREVDCPMEVGVTGLDRMAGPSSTMMKPVLWSQSAVAWSSGAHEQL